ncbi:MAG: MFS transporter [Beutenbergiaceae bacterium]
MRGGDEAARRRLRRRPPQLAIVVVLASSGLAAAFMFTLVVPIQAQLPELLDAGRDDTAWVVTSTLLASAVITPISGRLGDMYGKRRILMALLAVLVVGSVIAALSDGLAGVVVGRTLQGAVTGAVPLGIAIIRDVVHPERVAESVAVVSATMGVGGALGMPLSAFITQVADWHALFWMAATLGGVVLLFVWWIVPVSVMRTAGRFDFVGALGLAIGLLGVLLAISRGNAWGWTSPWVLLAGVGGIVMLGLWGWFELRISQPLLDLRIAARPAVLLTNISTIAFGFALFTSNVAYPQLLEMPLGVGGFGLTLFNASLVVMPAGLMMMILSPFAGRLAGKLGPQPLLVWGATAVLAAYAFTLLFAAQVWQIVVANLLIGIGFGFAAMPMLIMRSVPQSETGASNGVNALCRSLGTSSAAAVIGAVLAADTIPYDGGQAPTPAAFEASFLIGIAAAIVALVVALFVPRRQDPHEQHPSFPAAPPGAAPSSAPDAA